MHRYGDMNYLMSLDFDEVMEMYIKAKKEGAHDKLWQQWLIDYSRMTTETFISFTDYKKKTFKPEHKNGKTKEEILKEAEKIKTLDQRKGGN